MINRAVKFLRPRRGARRGRWSTQREPGITALVVTAVLRSGEVTPADPMVTRALTYLEGFIVVAEEVLGGGVSRELLHLDRSGGLSASERERRL